jgi:DNA polymerase
MSNISSTKVSWSGPDGAPILILGEAPGYDEEKEVRPFVGDAGSLLTSVLSLVGIDRESQCKIGNICNYRPSNNDFDYLRNSEELKQGLIDAKDYISRFRNQIKLVIICGKEPLRYLLDKDGNGAISSWRGSFIEKDSTLYTVVNHPAFVLYSRENYPIFTRDFRRISTVLSKGFRAPTFNFTIDPKDLELEQCLKEIEAADEITIDIETSRKNPLNIFCIGVGLSKERAICFGHSSFIGLNPAFRQTVERILASRAKKVYHFGYTFDTEVLHLLGFNTSQIDFDTGIAANTLNPEFPATLAFLASTMTFLPYWKDEGHSDDTEKGWSEKIDRQKLYEYNCKDCVATYQVYKQQQKDLAAEKLMQEDFDYKMSMVPVFKHINRTGMGRDEERVLLLDKIVKDRIVANQAFLNAVAGIECSPNSKIVLQDVLYNKFKLPLKKSPKTKQITTDEVAIIELIAYCQSRIEELKTPELKLEWQKKLVFLKKLLESRGYLKLESSYINVDVSLDRRVRSTYKWGTETNRAACSRYVDHTGWNAQTLPREVIEYDIKKNL